MCRIDQFLTSVGNMAAIQDVMNAMALILAQVLQYNGQEPPDIYFNKVKQAIDYGHNLAVGAFNDTMKVTVLSGKMEESSSHQIHLIMVQEMLLILQLYSKHGLETN